MQICCKQCAGILPTVDKLELNLRYSPPPKDKKLLGVYAKDLDDGFSKFIDVVGDSGFTPILDWRAKGKPFRVKELDVSIYRPTRRNGYYGLLLVNQPTEGKLQQVQDWLHSYVRFPDATYKDYVAMMRNLVKLHLMEFAYDFYFQGGEQDDYASLALRLGRSIYPLHAQNLYTVAIVDKEHRCGDGARNGTLLLYIQGTKRAYKMKPSDNLDLNPCSTQHTKIYEKRQDFIWGLRVEQTPSQTKLKELLKKHHMPFDPQNISKVLEIRHHLQFESFYGFKQADPLRFAKFIPDISQIPMGKRIDDCKCKAWLEETALMPVADAMRAISTTQARYGIKYSQKSRCLKTISFEEACNLPIPDGFHISERQRRKGKHPLPRGQGKLPPDVLAQKGGTVELMPFPHEQPESQEQEMPAQIPSLL